MNKELIKKFFENQTNSDESREVLKWFETEEGKTFLENKFSDDISYLEREDLHTFVPELDSKQLYQSIQLKIRHKRRNLFSLKRTDWLGYAVKAAASVLVILTAALFTISHEQYEADQIVEREAIYFETKDEQHREITLADGTIVFMNSNSELVVSKDYLNGVREIEISGEAFFDVIHDPKQPFIVKANQSAIEVLGTSFNVRANARQDNVQVAVVDGMVSFKNLSAPVDGTSDLSVILSKGQYGYMDITERTIIVEDLAVENYLMWKSGVLHFDGLPLSQVCRQLNRLYDLSCRFMDESIKNSQLTAKFSSESLEKTLSVIAVTLSIEYKRNGDQVIWSL